MYQKHKKICVSKKGVNKVNLKDLQQEKTYTLKFHFMSCEIQTHMQIIFIKKDAFLYLGC